MHDLLKSAPPIGPAPIYDGMRATADEFLALPDDEFRYELIDGVILMSPSPLPLHQHVALVIARQLADYLERNALGMVFPEVDVQLGDALVYRPELVFIRKEQLARIATKVTFPPDLIVEVISPASRIRDTRTKFADYERCGVREYWLIDPANDSATFFRLADGRYRDVSPASGHDSFASQAVPGFTLDLAAVRKAFRALG